MRTGRWQSHLLNLAWPGFGQGRGHRGVDRQVRLGENRVARALPLGRSLGAADHTHHVGEGDRRAGEGQQG